jgi:carbon monoxide dehydrogenase subunit G
VTDDWRQIPTKFHLVKLTATYRLPAPPERVFSALHDPAVLCRCIEGCESLVLNASGGYDARLTIGLGSIKGTYTGQARMADERPPEGFTLLVDGKGIGGWVKGSARMRLAAEPPGCAVTCDADGQVGGVIAAVGSRLIDTAARRLMDRFFEALAHEIAPSS